MSGYGGNLTYPSLRTFSNTDPGQLTGFGDDKYYPGANKTPFLIDIEGKGSIAGSASASSYEVVQTTPSVAKVSVVTLNSKLPCDACPYEFGFAVKTIARDPGVMNSLFYGKLRPYFGSDQGAISDGNNGITPEDHIRQTQIVTDLIVADTGLGNVDTEVKGAVVTAVMGVSILMTSNDDVLITQPSTGLSLAVTDIAATLNQTLLNGVFGTGENMITLTGSVLTSGKGFTVVQTSGSDILFGTDNSITLTTKSEYQDYYGHEVAEVTPGTVFTTTTEGVFARMTSDDVYVLFAHRRNDRGFANMWRQEKPGVYPVWNKMIMSTMHETASIHGASHGDNYHQVMEFYVPEITGTWKSADDSVNGTTTISYLEALGAWWLTDGAVFQKMPQWGLA